jgi:hypothetical protein
MFLSHFIVLEISPFILRTFALYYALSQTNDRGRSVSKNISSFETFFSPHEIFVSSYEIFVSPYDFFWGASMGL